MTQDSRHALVVLGMHRSGTSALTGGLTLCGAWAGEPEELTAANPENPKGFWERRDLRTLCDALLRGAGADWWRVADFDAAAVPAEVRAAQEAAWQEIAARLDPHDTWVIKEPRLCLLLPVLRPWLGRPVCIHVHRSPLEVARSLQRRNGFGIAEGLALWEAHTRAALAASADLPCAGLHYADLLADPAAVLGRLVETLAGLGVPGLALPEPGALEDFVTAELHREHSTAGEDAAFLSPAQAALWERLQADPLAPVGAAPPEPAVRQLLRDLDARKSAADALRTETARVAALSERLAQAGETGRQRKAELRSAQAHLRKAQEEGTLLRASRDAERARTAELRGQLKAAQQETAAEQKRAADAMRSARRLASAKEMSERELAKLRRDHARMLASTSWRVTAPLRATGDAVKRVRQGRMPVAAPASLRALGETKSVARMRRWVDRTRSERLLRASPLFDPAWYLAEYPEVAEAGLDPLRHFVERGRREGRNPSAGFDTADYMQRYPDVARSGLNPLVHYLTRGRKEGRSICPAARRDDREPAAFDAAAAAAWTAELRAHPAHAAVAAGEGPLVSVVMPTHNRAGLLPAAIASVLAQGYPRWELIVVDDGSTDGTAAMVRDRFDDPRIRVVTTAGLGVSGARNAGLEAATGALVAYLDSDNTWMPDYLELMVAEFARSGAACVYAVLKVRQEDTAGTRYWYRARPFDYEQLRFSNYIDLNIFMHRMDLCPRLGGFDTELRRAVDWDLILRYVRQSPVSLAYFVGAEYDHSDRGDRLTISELYAFKNVVRNKHWIDWPAEVERLKDRDPGLVSVVVSLRGPLENAEDRLQAVLTHPAGRDFELVLVDNGCDAVSRAILSDWRARHPEIRLVEVRENVHLALGSNLGLAASSGATVVFLHERIEVSPDWLRPLVRPLQDPAVLGVQPKVLGPDGAIRSAGLVFSVQSPFAYPLYAGLPGDFEPSNRPHEVAAISGLCAAFRATDLVAARGFYPIYTSEQQDVDLCLRIGGGAAVFRTAPDAVVHWHPGGPHIREARIEADRRQFRDRWADRIRPDDLAQYARDGLPEPQLLPDPPAWAESGLAVWRPARPAALAAAAARPAADTAVLAGRCVALKIGCPRPDMKERWGDYHFAAALAAALMRKGVRARIDFAADPARHAAPDDIDLVLRGRQRFLPRAGTVNLLWLISHPDRPSLEELRGFDHVFVASEVWAKAVARDSGLACETLLQCTDGARFHPMPAEPALHSPALFVANSRNVLRTIVREAIEQDLPIDIYGEMWEGLAPAEWIRGETIDNADLPRYYASADVVLNDHWDSMRENGFVSNRVFDVLACGTPLVTDPVAGLPADLAGRCHVFGDGVSLRDAVAAARAAGADRAEGLRVAELVRRSHSFDARADTIVAAILAALAAKRDGRRLAG